MYVMLFWGDVLGVLHYCGVGGLAMCWCLYGSVAWVSRGWPRVTCPWCLWVSWGGGPIFGMSVDFYECLSAGFSHVSRVYIWGWGFGSALVHL